jgi:hypothetical protein
MVPEGTCCHLSEEPPHLGGIEENCHEGICREAIAEAFVAILIYSEGIFL